MESRSSSHSGLQTLHSHSSSSLTAPQPIVSTPALSVRVHVKEPLNADLAISHETWVPLPPSYCSPSSPSWGCISSTDHFSFRFITYKDLFCYLEIPQDTIYFCVIVSVRNKPQSLLLVFVLAYKTMNEECILSVCLSICLHPIYPCSMLTYSCMMSDNRNEYCVQKWCVCVRARDIILIITSVVLYLQTVLGSYWELDSGSEAV